MNYEEGSRIEIPGLEAVMEYGDASRARFDRIPGSSLINDRSRLERVRLSAISGVHDDPDGRDSREVKSDAHGENTGAMFYGGRTVGLTGQVEAGSIPRLRDEWSTFRGQFGTGSKDLLLHSPFEVPVFYNEVLNPDLHLDAFGWDTANSGPGTLTDVSGGNSEASVHNVGEFALDGEEGDFMRAVCDFVDWSNEDVFIAARVKLHAAASGAPDITVGLRFKTVDGIEQTSQKATASAVSVGDWTWLTLRVDASLIFPTTTSVALDISMDLPADGAFTIRFTRCMLVFLQPSDPTPAGYFSALMHGYEPEGEVGRSRSFGPCYSVSPIPDPAFTDLKPGSTDLALWDPLLSAGVSSSVGPMPSARGIEGARSSRSMYFRAGKDSNTDARTMAAVAVDPTLVGYGDSSGYIAVAEGRTYKTSCMMEVLQKPNNDPVCLFLQWGDEAAVSTGDQSAAATLGVNELSVEAVAPAGAIWARVCVGAPSTTESGTVVELLASDVSFADVSEFDPGVPVLGSNGYGSAVVSRVSIDGHPVDCWTETRRLLPRPWLLRQVRKASDAKAPEQQENGLVKRPFTMSMRAADPRIYVLDERRRRAKLVGESQFVVVQGSDGFELGVMGSSGPTSGAGLPVPDGFTYEGNYVTYPSAGIDYIWSRIAYNYAKYGSAPVNHPAGGVGTQSWVTNTGNGGSNRPASDISTRMYRSAEGTGGFTYGSPRVVLGGAPSGYGGSGLVSNPDAFNLQIGNPTTAFTTYLNILLKRVGSGIWLELRWSALSRAYVDSLTNGLTAPYAFELWCSHDTSGSTAETKLASWDYESYDSTSGIYPFSLLSTPAYLVAWMLADVVYWELWLDYPNPVNFADRIESGSFELPSALAAVIGTSVPGQVGHELYISKADTQSFFNALSGHPPFVHYFEASNADVPPVSVSVPVIGDIDTPELITLTDVVDPVLTITTPEFDGQPARSTTARFTGTITASNPITIDLASDPSEASIKDSTGANAYSMLVVGSQFQLLRPGLNYVTIQAKSWGDSQEHLSVAWRDARR